MAKPGDVVAFRAGLHGIDAPQNIGIMLGRERRKGVPWVRLMTVNGPIDIKQEHVSRRAFRDRFDGRLADEAEVQGRIRQLVSRHAEGGLPEEEEGDLGALEEALWRTATAGDQVAWQDEQLARAHFGDDASPTQLKQVRECLDRCRRAGTGRFEAYGKGDTWRPWTQEEHVRLRQAWDRLGRLRAKLVTTVEDDEGRHFRRIPLDEAGLDRDDEATLAWATAAMRQWVEHDGVPDHHVEAAEPFDNGVAGIGGVGAVQVFGWDLHRQLGFLAGDWIRSESTTRSSDYVHFLLESGRWSSDDAVASLMRRHVNREPFFEHVPDEAAEQTAAALPEPDLAQDPEREDLRHLPCYTIDPPDAKDFDDAVGIEDTGDGERLWIHIADVSHYVTPGSRLDKHAKDRATSVYLPGRVLSMLPHRIADHLCSLRDDGDRFALSVHLDVDRQGRVADSGMHVSMIRVDENLAYADALARRDAGDPAFTALFDLAGRMRRHRSGLALDTGELKVQLEETGFSALEKRGDDATQMIETFMVAANEAVARYLTDRDVGVLFRCHPLPDAQKAERFGHQLDTMGYDIGLELPRTAGTKEEATQSLLDQLKAGGGKMQLFGGGLDVMAAGGGTQDAGADEPGDGGNDDETEAAQDDDGVQKASGFAAMDEADREAWLRPFRAVVDHLAAASDRDLADVATLKLLGCMGQAYYTPQNEGHFGLGSTHYCHFTSPIRRYPDLVVHRNLKAQLRGEELPHPDEDLGRMCDHCSNQERAAAGLERRIKSACLVLASLQGEPSGSARITGVTPASLFVRRDDGIEARVPARDLPGGPYSVDEWESMLYLSDQEAPQRFDAADLASWSQWYDEEMGERRIVRARLGDVVQIRLGGRDVADGRTGAEITGWHGGNAGP